jgi:hypothetical protein
MIPKSGKMPLLMDVSSSLLADTRIEDINITVSM